MFSTKREPTVRESLSKALASQTDTDKDVRGSIREAMQKQEQGQADIRKSVETAKRTAQDEEQQRKLVELYGEAANQFPQDTAFVRCSSQGHQHFDKIFKFEGLIKTSNGVHVKLADPYHPGRQFSLEPQLFTALNERETELAWNGRQQPALSGKEQYTWGGNSLKSMPMKRIERLDGEEERTERATTLEQLIPQKRSELATLAREYTQITGIEVKRTF